MKKTLMALLTVFIVVATFVAGCGGGSPEPKKEKPAAPVKICAVAGVGDTLDDWIKDHGKPNREPSDMQKNFQKDDLIVLFANGRALNVTIQATPEGKLPVKLEDLQAIVRLLREAGAKADGSCGIHVHVDASKHTIDSLQRLMNFAIGRQDLFYEALAVTERRTAQYCRKMNKNLFKAIQQDSVRTKASLERLWYSPVNDGYHHGIDHGHYNSTRYHGINLHAFFTKGTVEFRLFNGTTHAGKVKSYVQFCLAMSAWAIEGKSTSLHFRTIKNYTMEQKKALMLRVLKNRLGLKGKEFRTARLHLTAAFGGNAEAAAA